MDYVLVLFDAVNFVPRHGVGVLVGVTSCKIKRRLTPRRYGGRLISYGEYTTSQFFTVFIGVIFSGEAAAAFFSYTTSLTKSATAANYIFWLRRLKPAVQEDASKPPFDDGDDKGPAEVAVQDVDFAYESRPHAKVLESIHVDVSDHSPVDHLGF
jgi:ABC-type multidrug transport system fused ATPase/permease subunit